jgi:hypothetical protein
MTEFILTMLLVSLVLYFAERPVWSAGNIRASPRGWQRRDSRFFWRRCSAASARAKRVLKSAERVRQAPRSPAIC